MQPPFIIPVDVTVNPPFTAIIDDPEDVTGSPLPDVKVDIDKVSVQLSKTTIMFNTSFYGIPSVAGPDPQPLVLVTMMDTDQSSATGYTGPLSNDIGADNMAFAIIYPAGPTGLRAASDPSAFSGWAKRLPGLDVAALRANAASIKPSSGGPSGTLYLFKWNGPTNTWSPLIETYFTGLNSDGGEIGTFTAWQLISLVVMVSDGSMKVVQSAGDIWDITDTAPDRGHGATVPARDVAVTGIDASVAGGVESAVFDTPTFLTGQKVNVTATVANNGDETESDLSVAFDVYPILDSVPTKPGEPGYPAPTLVLGDPIALDSAMIESINPGDSGAATTAWVPQLALLPASGKAKPANGDGYVHQYLIRASVAPLPREVTTTDNSATLQADVEVGVEVRLSDIAITDTAPGSLGGEAVHESVYTGMSYRVKATVTNNGALSLTDYEVFFLVNGSTIGSQLVSLDPGASADVWQEWAPEAAGAGLEVRAEGAVLAGEINPDDNAVSTYVDVKAGVDVAVNTLTFTPALPAYGATVTFSSNVSNKGALDLSSLLVKFYMNETLIGSQVITSLPAGGDPVAVSQDWVADAVGSRTARVSIDPLPYEDNTDNNSRTAPISISGTDIGFAPGAIIVKPPTGFPAGTIKYGKSHQVQVTVKNMGTTPQTFKVRLTQSVTTPSGTTTTQIGTPLAVTAMAKGTSKTLTLIWTPKVTGSVTLRAEVGNVSGTTWVPGISGDINTENNAQTLPVVVAASVYDASVTGLAVSGTPVAGRPSTVSVTVANTGNEAEGFNVSLYADGTLVKTVAVKGLLPGKSRPVTFSWKPAAPGAYTLSAGVSGGDLPSDLGPRTFEATAMVYVPLSLKLTAGSLSPNGQVSIDIQLMDPSGKSEISLAGVGLSLKLPAGAARASSTALTTDASGHAVVYVTPSAGKKIVTLTITVPGLATKTIVIRL